MGKQLAREWRIFRQHIAVCAGAAFISAFCGILMWVNGTTAPIVFHTAVIPWPVLGLTGHFVTWLFLYGIFGFFIGMLLTLPDIPYTLPSLAVIAYTLCLAWYPVFFSLWHTIFAFLLLLAALLVSVTLCTRIICRTILCTLVSLCTIFYEIYFMVWTVMYIVFN